MEVFFKIQSNKIYKVEWMLINFKILLMGIVLFLPMHTMSAQSNEPIKVVTSFSILENLVSELGGDYVQITNLVDRNIDAHMYQPKPSDAIAIAKADLVITNGLGFEGWIIRLLENNNYTKERLVASAGVNVIKMGYHVDPHAWQSLKNIRIYVENISKSLISLKPEHSYYFTRRKISFLEKITQLENELTQQVKDIKTENRTVVTSHDAFGYLGKEFGFQFLSPVGLSTETEATATDVALIIQQIRRQNVQALFMENINNPSLLEQIAAETGTAIGGRLYSDSLGDVDGPAGSYLSMMRYNILTISDALKVH
jgi:zinc/manganese transport system substrate-binding protein